MFYDDNPFSSSETSSWKSEYTREMFEEESKESRRVTIEKMNRQVKMVLLGMVGMVGIVIIAEGFIWLYQWNHAK